jgi:hypothetical protein
MRRFHHHLTFANMASVIALFVALGGVAVASVIITSNSNVAKNTISGHNPPSGDHPNIIRGSVTGADVKESTLGPVPAIKAPEAWHEVGTSGEPSFENGWNNSGGSLETVAFYKDREGVVHLKGGATGSNNMAIFSLPAGYRPASGKQLRIAAVCNCTGTDSNTPTPDAVSLPTGNLTIYGTSGFLSIGPAASFVSLDGITFRAGG